MNNIKVFNHTEFGELSVLIIDGKEYFPATECARILKYANPHKAINDHCRYLTKREVPHPQNPDKSIVMNFIPEGDFYRLIVRSNLPAAERFERWVFDEVLPSIRKHTEYMLQMHFLTKSWATRSMAYACFLNTKLLKKEHND